MLNVSDCAQLCQDTPDCLSFDHSPSQQTCILHSHIEGPPSLGDFENIFQTVELQEAEGYTHHERLGVGNSTQMELSGLRFEHNVEYYINLRLRNALGYESVISSSGFLVDLTPPLPGLVGAASSVSRVNVLVPGGCDVVPEVPVPPGCLEPVLSRTIDL